MRKKAFGSRFGVIWALFAVLVISSPSSSLYAQDLKKVADEFATQIHALGHSRVTVVDFLDLDGKPSKLGKLLSQELETALTDSKLKLQVVDQGHLGALFDQIKKAEEGLLDPATSRALGKIAGTEVMIVGTVMPSSMTIKLQAKAIDLETAKLIDAKSASLPRIGLRGALATESEGGGEGDEADESVQGEVVAKTAKPKNQTPARVLRDQGVIFEFNECSMRDNALECDLTITSEGRDRRVAVYLGSRAWADNGDEHQAEEVTIANSSSNRNCARKELLRGVATPVSMTFPNFGEDSSLVQRLRVYWQETEGCYSGARPVDFEKIAFSEDAGYSSKKGSHGSGGQGGGGAAKGKGGLLQRLGNPIRKKLEDGVMRMLDEEVEELVGGGEEEEDATPKKKKK